MTRHYVAVTIEPAVSEDGEAGTMVTLTDIGTKAATLGADAAHVHDDDFERMLGQIVGERGGAYIVVTSEPVYGELVELAQRQERPMSHPKAIGIIVLLEADNTPPAVIGEA